MNLDDLLRVLARQGYWISAWYPLSNGDFECRIAHGVETMQWATCQYALGALREAMTKADLL